MGSLKLEHFEGHIEVRAQTANSGVIFHVVVSNLLLPVPVKTQCGEIPYRFHFPPNPPSLFNQRLSVLNPEVSMGLFLMFKHFGLIR